MAWKVRISDQIQIGMFSSNSVKGQNAFQPTFHEGHFKIMKNNRKLKLNSCCLNMCSQGNMLCIVWRPSQGFWGQGNNGIYFREQGNKSQILRGTGEERQYWGTGNIENKFSIFLETGEQAILFQGNKEQVPPPTPGGPQYDLLCKSCMYFCMLK